MPLARFVLILVLVIAAAAVTVAAGTFAAASFELPAVGAAAAIPMALAAYVVVRVIWDRARSAEDRHYDGVEK